MAIFVETENPNGLISKIKKAIDNKAIVTWTYDKDGDFTHNVDQWRNCGWIHAIVEVNRIVFSVLCRRDRNMSVSEYAVYHGRFVEMLLTHFDKECLSIKVTPLASNYDIINTNVK